MGHRGDVPEHGEDQPDGEVNHDGANNDPAPAEVNLERSRLVKEVDVLRSWFKVPEIRFQEIKNYFSLLII